MNIKRTNLRYGLSNLKEYVLPSLTYWHECFVYRKFKVSYKTWYYTISQEDVPKEATQLCVVFNDISYGIKYDYYFEDKEDLKNKSKELVEYVIKKFKEDLIV